METEGMTETPLQQPDGGAAAPADGAQQNDTAIAAQLAEANARADDNHAKMLYALADFENYKKRNERFLQDRLAAGRRALVAKFLPVLDNLERALRFERESEGLRGGLEATQRGFEALLSSEDVRPIDVLGKPFDPHVAEAIGTRETTEVAENVVVEEVQRGYKHGDDVLRPSRVIVSTRPEHASPHEQSAAQDDVAAHAQGDESEVAPY